MLVDLDDSPDVVAVVITLGQSRRLQTCLESLARTQSAARLAVLCVVNGSGEIEPPRDIPISVRQTHLNTGWSGGIGYARTQFEAPLLWLIQDDLTVTPTCLEALRAPFADEPNLAALSPLALTADGLVDTASCGGIVGPDGAMESWYPPHPVEVADLEPPVGLSYVRSSGLLVRTTAFDAVGGWDARFYPVLWGDVDFSWRLKAAGWTFRTELTSPEAHIRHEVNGSTPKFFAEFLGARNGSLFRAKWFPSKDEPPSPLIAGMVDDVDPSVDPALISRVARSSSDTLLDFARYANAKMAEMTEWNRGAADSVHAQQEFIARQEEVLKNLRAEIDRLTALTQRANTTKRELAAELSRIKTSRSWKLTRPLRTVGSRLK